MIDLNVDDLKETLIKLLNSGRYGKYINNLLSEALEAAEELEEQLKAILFDMSEEQYDDEMEEND
jgi:hypothetical protein